MKTGSPSIRTCPICNKLFEAQSDPGKPFPLLCVECRDSGSVTKYEEQLEGPPFCEDCKFSRPINDVIECHRHAPPPTTLAAMIASGNQFITMWPTVQPNDWRGEHAPMAKE